MSLTKKDLKTIGDLFDQKFDQKFDEKFDQKFRWFLQELPRALEPIFATKQDLFGLEHRMRDDFSQLQTSVDTYLKRTEVWHDEHIVLKARHDKLAKKLVEKQIVTEQDLAL